MTSTAWEEMKKQISLMHLIFIFSFLIYPVHLQPVKVGSSRAACCSDGERLV